ncbi:MAG: glycosyl hydrolase-related protein [Thermoguttaceae bacterium]
MKKSQVLILLALLLARLLLAQPALASDPNASGSINLIEFSHHDLGWHKGSFVNESRTCDDEINAALDRMRTDPAFTWTHEYARYIFEYLKKYPGRYDELASRLAEGRFDMGAGYSQPYTSFVTSEMLARQFIYGKKWTEETFPGYESKVYYNTDVPALGSQTPQILSKAGVKYLYASRSWDFKGYDVNEYKLWKALDGSTVNALFMSHYSSANGVSNPLKFLPGQIETFNQDKKNLNIGNALPVIVSYDCMPPQDMSRAIKTWNTYAEEKGLPLMQYGVMQRALDQIFIDGSDFSATADERQDSGTLSGEWPNKWLYENSASAHETFLNQREASRYLCAAETLAVIRAILTGSFSEYPVAELEEGWRHCDFSCHGYAPAAAIEEFKDEYKQAYDIAKRLYDEQLDWLVSHIAAQEKTNAIAFAVYNNLSWDRDDAVTMDKPESVGDAFKIVDSEGVEVAYQLTSDGQIVFVATDVPSMGYKTYYFQPGAPSSATEKVAVGSAWKDVFENRYYAVTPVAGGGALESIIDKTNNSLSLFAAEKFKIGEVYDFQYDGRGAGEQLHIWQPHDGASYLNKFAEWKCVESGPVRTVFETEATGTDRGSMRLRVALYEDLKKINFTMTLDNLDSARQRQVRLMFPVNSGSMFGEKQQDSYYYADNSDVSATYETPFGAVTIGDEIIKEYSRFNENTNPNGVGQSRSGANAGGIFQKADPINSAVRPREVQNWISAKSTSKNFSVTLSSYNLCWDYQDATAEPGMSPVLQPVLFSTSESCHGNYAGWLQPGKHVYNFSMTSGQADDATGRKMCVAANNPLDARLIENTANDGITLPASYRGFSVDQDNVMISAVKKAEDNNRDIVVRIYETEGKKDNGAVAVTLPDSASIESAKTVGLIEQEEGFGRTLKTNGNTLTIPTGAWSIETAMVRVSGIKDSPMTPRNLRVSPSGNRILVSWVGKGEDTTYKLEARTPGKTWRTVVQTEETSAQLEPLFGRYTFRVSSQRNGDQSNYLYSDTFNFDELIDNVKCTASSNYSGQPYTRACDRSGLSDRSVDATHDNKYSNTWLTADDNKNSPVWVEFDLGAIYELGKTYIWNYNQPNTSQYPTLLNAGFKYATIKLSTDGERWEQFKNGQCTEDEGHNGQFKFAQGSGEEKMPASNLADGKGVLNFGGRQARYVRFEVSNEVGVGNWGWYVEEQQRNNFGLSEVMFTRATNMEVDALASLKELSVEGLRLERTGCPEADAYDLSVPYGKCNITVVAVPDDPEATVDVNGQKTIDGMATLTNDGLTAINVKCVSRDGKTTAYYTINVKYIEQIIPYEATASSQESGNTAPKNVIDNSGMTNDDFRYAKHDNQSGAETMWNSAKTDDYSQVWLKIDLGADYYLGDMLIWNQNQRSYNMENTIVNRGMQNVYIYYATEEAPDAWIKLVNTQSTEDGVFKFAKADGEPDMIVTNLADGKGPVDFGGKKARYVKIAPAGGVNVGNYGGYRNNESMYGLSELRFTSYMGGATEQTVSGAAHLQDR